MPIIIISVSLLVTAYNFLDGLGVFENAYGSAVAEADLVAENDEDAVAISTSGVRVKKITADEAKIDINLAGAEKFLRLPGIGRVKADAIVKQRARMGGFSTVDDIVCTDGIGTALLERIRPFITISGNKEY